LLLFCVVLYALSVIDPAFVIDIGVFVVSVVDIGVDNLALNDEVFLVFLVLDGVLVIVCVLLLIVSEDVDLLLAFILVLLSSLFDLVVYLHDTVEVCWCLC